MSMRSKTEWDELKKERQEEADKNLQEGREIKEDAQETVVDWNRQGEASLQEVVEQLSETSRDLGDDIEKTYQEQAQQVEQALEAQTHEVKEPAAEDETKERQAAENLEAGSTGDERRFGERLAEGAGVRQEAAEFFREIVEDTEQNQEKSTEQLDEYSQELDQAIESIDKFDL